MEELTLSEARAIRCEYIYLAHLSNLNLARLGSLDNRLVVEVEPVRVLSPGFEFLIAEAYPDGN